MERPRVAVIGAGISGLLVSWGLGSTYQVVLHEAGPAVGGRAEELHPFTPLASPRFVRLMDTLGLAVSIRPPTLTVELSSAPFRWPPTPAGMLQVVRQPRLLGLMKDFLQTLRLGEQVRDEADYSLTLASWAQNGPVSTAFLQQVLYPLVAGSQGVPLEVVPHLSAYPVLGHLVMPHQEPEPRWSVVEGGMQRVVEALANKLTNVEVRPSSRVGALLPCERGCEVLTEAGRERFDAVVVATEAAAVIELLAGHHHANARAETLAALTFDDVAHAVHSDPALMPARPGTWAEDNVVRHQGGFVFTRQLTSGRFRSIAAGGGLPGHPGFSQRQLRMAPPVQEAQRIVARDQGQGAIWITGGWTQGLHNHESMVEAALKVIVDLSSHDGTAPDRILDL